MVADPKDPGLSGFFEIHCLLDLLLGSDVLNKILVENEVLMNVHGHTHYC